MFALSVPVAVLALVGAASAQTSTQCNPLHESCPADPALGTTFEQTYNQTMTEFDPKFYNITAGQSLISFSEKGAELAIAEEGQSITVETAFYIFFGRVEMIFQAASGQGIISTFNLLSDDLDEIDVEIVGGNTTTVSNNYYGWGNQSELNGEYPAVSWPGGAQGGMHNYTVDWTKEKLDWIFDGNVVRSVPYQAAGKWPQTPCYVKFGIWAGGDPKNKPGVIQWAGGKTDYSKGPFTMTVQSLKVVDGTTNSSFYSYGDHSGTYESIKVQNGQSSAFQALNQKSTTQDAQQKWSGLSTGAKIGIACGVLGGLAVAFVAFLFYCLRQRKAGRLEKAAQDQEWEQQHAELLQYKNQMAHGHFAVSHLSTHPNKY